jgi:hypothetical protein
MEAPLAAQPRLPLHYRELTVKFSQQTPRPSQAQSCPAGTHISGSPLRRVAQPRLYVCLPQQPTYDGGCLFPTLLARLVSRKRPKQDLVDDWVLTKDGVNLQNG